MLRPKTIITILLIAAALLIWHGCGSEAPSGHTEQTLSADDQLSAAWRSFAGMDTAGAAERFADVAQASDATTDQKQQALYGLILSRRHGFPTSDVDEALTAVEQFIATYPDAALAPWVLLEKGHLQQTMGRPDQARDIFGHIVAHYPQSAAVHEAALALANSYFYATDDQLGEKGITVLKNHLQAYPGNPLERTMLFRIAARLGETRGQYAEAIPYAERLGELKMCDPFRWGQQFWFLAQVYRRELHDDEKAAHWYQEIVDECTFDPRVFSAKQMIQRIQENDD